MSLPPLTGLPDPPTIPLDSPAMATPDQIMVSSRKVLRQRILATAWIPGITLLGLWYLLLISYVAGTSPTFWALGLLAGLFEPALMGSIVRSFGFDTAMLGISFLVVPLLCTLASAALLPLSVHLVATMNPRMYLTEVDFQRSLARRAGIPLILPPLLAVVLTVLSAPLGIGPHWEALSAGALGSTCAALLWTLLAWQIIRRSLSAQRLLRVPSAAAQMGIWDRSTRGIDPRERATRLAVLLAQDRRHLPPVPSRLAVDMPTLLRQVGRTMSSLGAAAMPWIGYVVLPVGWLVFSILDAVVVFERLANTSSLIAAPVKAVLPWQVYAIGLPLLAGVAVLSGLAPRLAMLLSRGARGQVIDERTYPRWEQRAAGNAWEVRVVNSTGAIVAGIALVATVILAPLLQLTGGMNAVGWVWIVLDVLLVVPLLGVATVQAMRRDLRDVLYGPAGLYSRRRSPYVLVAPDHALASETGSRAPEGSGAQDLYRAAAPGDAAYGTLPDFGAGQPDVARDRTPSSGGHRIPGDDSDLRMS